MQVGKNRLCFDLKRNGWFSAGQGPSIDAQIVEYLQLVLVCHLLISRQHTVCVYSHTGSLGVHLLHGKVWER